jgi:hypothetical protein
MTSKIKICTLQGCGKPIYAKGHCKYHYKKHIFNPRKETLLADKAKEDHEAAKRRRRDKHRTDRMASLTPEQLEKLFMTPCKSERDLKNYIKFFFGLHLPDHKVSRYADTTPFGAIWEVYNICVNKVNPEGVQELLYVAGRGSGKTLGMALAELLVILHDQRDTVHVGAILSQAKRCYEYQQKFLLMDPIKNIVMPAKVSEDTRILAKSTMEKSTFNIRNNKITLEVLPCTLRACLVSSSRALNEQGAIKTLADFKVGDLIRTPSGFVEVIDNSLQCEECLRVELDDGRVIEGTLDHRVWTSAGWVKLQDLKEEHEILNDKMMTSGAVLQHQMEPCESAVIF